MKLKKYLIIGVICCSYLIKAQQQTLFTNFINNPFLYNPAYAGVFQGQEYTLQYRQQWNGFENAPRTAYANGYGTLKKKPNMAIGGTIMNDRVGLLNQSAFSAAYAYHLKLNKNYKLGFGISAGAAQYNVKIYDAKPYPTDLDDPFLRSNILNANVFDANAGLYLYSSKFFFSFSSLSLVSSRINWNNTNGKLTAHNYVSSGYNFTLDKKKKEWVLQPSILARFNAPAPYQLEGNLKLTYKNSYWIGFNYRQNASLSGMIGATIKDQFTIAYAYDYTTSQLQNYSTGSHEIVLKFSKASKKRKTNTDKVLDADEEEFNNIDNSIKSNLKNKKTEDEKK